MVMCPGLTLAASLPACPAAWLQAVSREYDAQYIVKVDDDVYLRLDRLPHAVQQWGDIHAGLTPLRAVLCAAGGVRCDCVLLPGGAGMRSAQCLLSCPHLPDPALSQQIMLGA